MIQFGKDAMELHDICAVWCAIDNPPRKGFSEDVVNVDLKDGWKVLKRKFQIERLVLMSLSNDLINISFTFSISTQNRRTD